MAVRVFSGSVIVLDEGALDTVFNGAVTVAVLFKRSGSTTDGTQFLLSFDAAVNSNQRAAVSYSAASALQLTINGTSRTFGASFTIANDTWYLFVVRKASGTVTPTANLYNYTTTSWVGWTNASGTLDNDATTLVEVRLGNGPGAFPLNGKMAGAVVYNSVLSNTDGETLETSAQNWFDLLPSAMWRLNQASVATPVTDDTAGDADQTAITGTSVDAVDVPDWDPNLGGGTQTIIPSGIASATAFGTAVVSAANTVAPGSIGSAEAFGTATVGATNTIAPGGIGSAEAFGTAAVSAANTISSNGIGSAEAFGTATITAGSVGVAPGGIGSAEAFGTAAISAVSTIAPTGIGSGEAFGTATVAATNVILPGGIGSAEAFGTATISTSNVILPGGIASGEAFGNPLVALQGTQLIAPPSIASGEAFGTATVSAGAVTIAPTGIGSAEAFGTATILAGSVIQPAGIGSGQAFGIPVLSAGPVGITPAGIPSAEAFGTPTVTDSSLGQIIAPIGIPSGEAFGTPYVWIHIVRACDCSVLVGN